MRKFVFVTVTLLVSVLLIVDGQSLNGAPLLVAPLFGFDSFSDPGCTGNRTFGGLFPAACTQISPGVFRVAIGNTSEATILECKESGCPLDSCNTTVTTFTSGACDITTNTIYTFFTSVPAATNFPSGVITFEQFLSPCAVVETAAIGYFASDICVPNGDGTFFKGACVDPSQFSNATLLQLNSCVDSLCTSCTPEVIVSDDCANSFAMYHCPKATPPPPPPPPSFDAPFVEVLKFAPGSDCVGTLLEQQFISFNCLPIRPDVFQKAEIFGGSIRVSQCIDSACSECSTVSISSPGVCQQNVIRNVVGNSNPSAIPNGIIIAGSADCTGLSLLTSVVPTCRPVGSKFEQIQCANNVVTRTLCDDDTCSSGCSSITSDPSQCVAATKDDLVSTVRLFCPPPPPPPPPPPSNNTNNNTNPNPGNSTNGGSFSPPFWGILVFSQPSCSGALNFGRILPAGCSAVGPNNYRMAILNKATGAVDVLECDAPDCNPLSCFKVTTFGNNVCNAATNTIGFFADTIPDVKFPNGSAFATAFSDGNCSSPVMQYFSVQNTCIRFLNTFEKVSCNAAGVTQSVCTDSGCSSCKTSVNNFGTCSVSQEFSNIQFSCDLTPPPPPPPPPQPLLNPPLFTTLTFAGVGCTGDVISGREFSANCFPFGSKFRRVVSSPPNEFEVQECTSKDCTQNCVKISTFVNATCDAKNSINFFFASEHGELIVLPKTATVFRASDSDTCDTTVAFAFDTPVCSKDGNFFRKISCDANRALIQTNCSDTSCAFCTVNQFVPLDTCAPSGKFSDFEFSSFICPGFQLPKVPVSASVEFASFSDKGDQITVGWTGSPLFLADVGFFPCSKYFGGIVANISSCSWRNAVTLVMFPSSSVKLSLPVSFDVISKSFSVVLNQTNFIVTLQPASVSVSAPVNPVPPVAVVVGPSRVNPCFSVEFDGSKSLGAQLSYFWSIEPAVLAPLVTGIDTPVLSVAPNAFALDQQQQPKTFTVSLTVQNLFGQNNTVSVTLVSENKIIPQIVVFSDRDFTASALEPVRLEARISFPASCTFNLTGTSNFSFAWTIFFKSDASSVNPLQTFTQKSQAIIIPGTLSAGSYKAVFSVNLNGVAATETVNFVLIQPSPVAIIKPLAQFVGKNQNVTFSASASLFVTKSTEFLWSCQSNQTLCKDSNGKQLTFVSVSEFILSTNVLNPGLYTFCVQVSNEAGSSFACVSIELIDAVIPFVSIVPFATDSVNPAEKLSIQTVVVYSLPLSRLTFVWSVTSGSLAIVGLRLSGSNLVIPANTLVPGSSYTLTLTVNDTVSGVVNFASVSFNVNSAPSGGSISVSANSGLQMSTSFDIQCIGASDNDSPLSFRFGYSYTDDSVQYFIGGVQSSATARTVFAKPGNVTIFALVYDKFGAFSKFSSSSNIEILVDPNLDSKAAITSSISNLKDILANGDSLGALTTLSNVGQLLDQGSLSEAELDQLAESLVSTLSSFFNSPEILSDPAAVENVASTLLAASQSASSVSVLQQALGIIDSLLTSATMSPAAAGSTFGVMSSCYTIAQSGDDENFVDNIATTLNTFWNLQVGTLAAGEDPVVFTSPSMDLVAGKMDAFTSTQPFSSSDCSSQFDFEDKDALGDVSVQLIGYQTDFSSQENSTSKVVEVNIVGASGKFAVNITIPLKNPIVGDAQCRYRSQFGEGWTVDPSCVLVDQQPTFIVCSCSHLTQFSGEERVIEKPGGTGETPAGENNDNVTGIVLGVVFGVLGFVAILSIVVYIIYYKLKLQKDKLTDLPN